MVLCFMHTANLDATNKDDARTSDIYDQEFAH